VRGSNRFPLKQIIKKLGRKSGPGRVVDMEVKRRIAALVLAYSRGWSADRVSRYFGWPPDEVASWLEMGKVLSKKSGDRIMKSLEQQLVEKQREIDELRGTGGRSGVSGNLTRLLSESGLPEAAQSRLRKRLRATEKADVIKAAITEEKHYVLGVRSSASRQKQDGRSLELVESYRSLGLSEKEAKIAARVESAVENISESRQKLANAAKLLGLSDAECAEFANI
jgi:DNA-directed RNA polymerase specialized sigma24 family protein